MAEHC